MHAAPDLLRHAGGLEVLDRVELEIRRPSRPPSSASLLSTFIFSPGFIPAMTSLKLSRSIWMNLRFRQRTQRRGWMRREVAHDARSMTATLALDLRPSVRWRIASFIQIDRDNFNDVMAGMNPGLKMKVDNKLAEEGGEMAVDLKFNSIEDFEPARVRSRSRCCVALLETRAKLRDLMSKVDRSENSKACSSRY